MEKIAVTGKAAGGREVANGCMAIDPQGNAVRLTQGAPLKKGWRFATQEDLDKVAARSKAGRTKRGK